MFAAPGGEPRPLRATRRWPDRRVNEFDYIVVGSGTAGWRWPELLPYFVRTEDQTRLPGPLHGRGGVLSAVDLANVHPITTAMIEAARQHGLARRDDFNGGDIEGAALQPISVRHGKRSSVASNAIAPAINSPQLLQLSGIGPAAELQRHGIAVQHHLPGVGENLQDHCIVPMAWRCKPGVRSLNEELSGWRSLRSALRYALQRRGAPAGHRRFGDAHADLGQLQRHQCVDRRKGRRPGARQDTTIAYQRSRRMNFA